MLYFDYAATSRTRPDTVIQAVCEAMQSFGNSGRAAHGGSLETSRTIYQVRSKIARYFACPSPGNVIFTSNATEALNIVIFGLFSAGDHVISTDLEHNSVLRPLYEMEKKGVEVSFCPADKKGRINYQDFEKLLQKNTKAVICTHGSNLTGNVLDLEWIGRFCRAHDLLFLVDASQTAGFLPISLEKMQIDALCFTGHKSLMGPQGTGGICLSKRAEIRPWKMGGTGVQTYLKHQPNEYPTRLEAGTLNGHGIAGLGAAIDYIEALGQEQIYMHEIALARSFCQGVQKIPGVTVYGDWGQEVRCPIVSLNLGDMDSGMLADILWDEYEIATRAGAHCAPRMHEALGTKEQGAVRFSFGWYNTEQEVDQAIEALGEIAL